MYFNLETCAWDKKLCEFFKVNMTILPKIKSCSEVLGYVHEGVLRGVGIYGCITEQQGALLGQMCFRREQVALHFTHADVHLLVNTGREIIHSDHNMLSTVAFQLGAREPVFYALEGLLPGSGSSVEWLNRLTRSNNGLVGDNQNPLLTMLSESIYCSPNSPASTLCGTPPQLPQSNASSVGGGADSTTGQFKTAAQCNSGTLNLTTGSNLLTNGSHLGLSTTTATIGSRNRKNIIFFVPARDKVLLPGCGDTYSRGHSATPMGATTSRQADPTRGLIYGVTKDTSPVDLIQAAYEGICFQVKQLLGALQKDCKSWHPLKRVTVGGELIEANAVHLAQTLADYCDLQVDYPQTEAVSALGAMIAAGLALNLFTLDSIKESMAPPTTVYQRSLRLTETEGKYRRWEALQLAIWEVSDGEHSENEEEEDVEYVEGRAEGGFIKNNNKVMSPTAMSVVIQEERYKDPLYNVHRSIPGTVFAIIAFATLILAEGWQMGGN